MHEYTSAKAKLLITLTLKFRILAENLIRGPDDNL